MAEKSCEVSIRTLAHRISTNHLLAPPLLLNRRYHSQRTGLVLHPQARRQCGGGGLALALFLYRGHVRAGNCQNRQPSHQGTAAE
ncbi:hypothetical protein CGRA01v4_02795 [Colletotrichum graminicola]|nr:hypothetical protein CGRA01v4_02795 [Colletotrichum graminicola]